MKVNKVNLLNLNENSFGKMGRNTFSHITNKFRYLSLDFMKPQDTDAVVTNNRLMSMMYVERKMKESFFLSQVKYRISQFYEYISSNFLKALSKHEKN